MPNVPCRLEIVWRMATFVSAFSVVIYSWSAGASLFYPFLSFVCTAALLRFVAAVVLACGQ